MAGAGRKEQWLQSPEVHNSWKNFWLSPAAPKFHSKRGCAGPRLKEVFVPGRRPPARLGARLVCCLFHRSQLPGHGAQRLLSLNFGSVYSKQGLVRHVLLPRSPLLFPPAPPAPRLLLCGKGSCPCLCGPSILMAWRGGGGERGRGLWICSLGSYGDRGLGQPPPQQEGAPPQPACPSWG